MHGIPEETKKTPTSLSLSVKPMVTLIPLIYISIRLLIIRIGSTFSLDEKEDNALIHFFWMSVYSGRLDEKAHPIL